MPKCPHCKEEIDRLNVTVDERNVYAYKDGDIDFSHHIEFIEWEFVSARCPKCHETITEDRTEADEFLEKQKGVNYAGCRAT